jgi:predicted phosphohydrolase
VNLARAVLQGQRVLFFTSDLHYDHHGISGRRAVEALGAELAATASPGDVLVLGGDLGNSDAVVRACLACFRDFPGKKLGVAGNHDIWVEPGESSWDRYKRLSDVFVEAGVHPLEDEPVVVGGVGFAGALGWYDYSFRDDIGVPYERYVEKSLPSAGVAWGDARYAHWGLSDEAFTDWQLERLDGHLARLASCKEVVVFTHHVATRRLLVHPRSMVPTQWRFLNAFLGSEKLETLFARHPNVTEVVNGHIHRNGEVRIGRTRYTSLGCGKGTRQVLVMGGGRTERREVAGS